MSSKYPCDPDEKHYEEFHIGWLFIGIITWGLIFLLVYLSAHNK
jgi:hypothetical protein